MYFDDEEQAHSQPPSPPLQEESYGNTRLSQIISVQEESLPYTKVGNSSCFGLPSVLVYLWPCSFSPLILQPYYRWQAHVDEMHVTFPHQMMSIIPSSPILLSSTEQLLTSDMISLPVHLINLTCKCVCVCVYVCLVA